MLRGLLMTSERYQIIAVRALFHSVILALVCFWSSMASAQGIRVDDLSKDHKTSIGFTLENKSMIPSKINTR
jgi:hypothetical protein